MSHLLNERFILPLLPFSQIDWDLKKEASLQGKKITEKGSIKGDIGTEFNVIGNKHLQSLRSMGRLVSGQVIGVLSEALLMSPQIQQKRQWTEQGGRTEGKAKLWGLMQPCLTCRQWKNWAA